MNSRHSIVLLIVAAASAAGSFVATHAWQPPATTEPSRAEAPCSTMPGCGVGCCKSLASWLGLESAQVRQVEKITKEYSAKRITLESALFAERRKLAELFDSNMATDEQILQHVERVIQADSALERCVVAHLVALRPHLTGKQRARLYRRCAKGVRDAGGCQWRHAGANKPDCGGPDRGRSRSPVGGCNSQPSGCGSPGHRKDARPRGTDGR